ncbi:MAG: hypothetical protein DRP57_07130 [Spirochaetes bacterium]|nr:MAG: hypothetical protein DRP57_07130 [Spirochaetota bacterium]
MFDKEKVEEILKGIVWLNKEMGIWALIVPAVFAAVVLFLLYSCYKNPGKKTSRLLLAVYVLIYIYSGFTIFIGKDFMGLKEALTGAVALWIVAVLLIADIIFNWTEVRLPEKAHLKIISVFFILAGIFFYPLLEIALGFVFPRMVFIGAECPTTISLIGIFIGSIPRVNKPLFILVSLNAIFTGASVALNGAPFDYLYAASGIFGLLMLVIYFRDIFLGKKKL